MSLSAFSAEKVELTFSEGSIKQGEIVSAHLKADSNTVQSVDFQKWKGQTLGKTLYFYSVSPLMRKDGETSYEGEAKVIFVITPENSQISDSIQGKEVQIKWNQITVEAVEAQKSFLFADFDVPYPKSFLAWVLSILGLIAVALAGWFGYKKIQDRNLIKTKRLKLKSEIVEAKSFEEVVDIWKKKRAYTQQFPHLEEPFEKLEAILFKYQFKQHQSMAEKEEVVKAYELFVASVRGGFDGI